MLKILLAAVFVFFLGWWVGKSSAPAPESTNNFEAELTACRAQLASVSSDAKPCAVTAHSPVNEAGAAAPTPRRASEEPSTSPAPQPDRTKVVVAMEKVLQEISTASEVKTFLEEAAVKDIAKELSAAQPVSKGDPLIDFLSGTFSGEVIPKQGYRGFFVSLDANLRVRNEALNGRLNIRLSRNGKVFSRNSQNGVIQTIQRMSGSQGILVSTADYHFQLFYLPQLESLEGNVYYQYSPGKFREEGTIHLEKN